jgi:hypothetical protein
MCLFLETLVVNISTPLFQRVPNIDCSRLGIRLDRVYVKSGTVKRTNKSYFSLLGLVRRINPMARYLLRSGKYADVDARPNHLDVVAFRNQSGEFIYALLSDDAERDLLSLQ